MVSCWSRKYTCGLIGIVGTPRLKFHRWSKTYQYVYRILYTHPLQVKTLLVLFANGPNGGKPILVSRWYRIVLPFYKVGFRQINIL